MPPQSQSGNNMNSTPNTTPIMPIGSVMPQQKQPKKSIGPVIGIIIIVLVLVLGGLYFWGESLNSESVSSTDEIRDAADASIANFQSQSSSDEISSIQADIDATNLNGIDKELQDIGNTLGQ